jgi:hypothetical protein
VKFPTKLWKRSKKSFATTIPHVVLLDLDEDKQHNVVWEYDASLKKWTIAIVPEEEGEKD